jgi:signal peptidase I
MFLRRVVRAMAAGVLLVAWLTFLRPAALGGPVGFVLVSGTSMQPNLQPGDLVVLRRLPDYEIGDIVAFHLPEGQGDRRVKVIHRIIGGSARSGYVLQGDNRQEQDLWRPRPDEIHGEAWVRIPAVGSLLVNLRSNPLALAAASASTTVLALLLRRPRKRPEPEPPSRPAGVPRPTRGRVIGVVLALGCGAAVQPLAARVGAHRR